MWSPIPIAIDKSEQSICIRHPHQWQSTDQKVSYSKNNGWITSNCSMIIMDGRKFRIMFNWKALNYKYISLNNKQ
jgi:hypothetical protein